MRDDVKSQLAEVNARITKAKTSLEKMEDLAEPQTLSMEMADIIPLGQFPEEENERDIKK